MLNNSFGKIVSLETNPQNPQVVREYCLICYIATFGKIVCLETNPQNPQS